MSTKHLWEQYAARSRWAAGASYQDLPPLDEGHITRRHIIFAGQVQGVGFRYRCKLHADALGVTGWCKNLVDGRVECEVQSDPARIALLLEALQNQQWIRIAGMELQTIPLIPEEKTFIIFRY
jgi:acylphosphatase